MSCAMPLAICPSARRRSCCIAVVLRLAQVVVCLAQRAVQARLVRRERDVPAELHEEFAIAAAEGSAGAARGDEDAEHARFHRQRRDHQRAKAAGGEPLRKWKRRRSRVGLVDQPPADAARQAVLVDRDFGSFRRARASCASARLAAPTVFTRERRGGRVVQADAAEVDGQVFLDVAQHHLEDARQVLPVADGGGDVLQAG